MVPADDAVFCDRGYVSLCQPHMSLRGAGAPATVLVRERCRARLYSGEHDASPLLGTTSPTR